MKFLLTLLSFIALFSCSERTKVNYTLAVKSCTFNTWDTIKYTGNDNSKFQLFIIGNRTKVTELDDHMTTIASNVCEFQIINGNKK